MPTQDFEGIFNGVTINSTTIGPFTKDAAGEVINPTQPAFLAQLSTKQNDVTGDGTLYTIVCDTEIKDQNSDYAAGTFTAPVTGVYHFYGQVHISGLAGGNTTGYIQVSTSNRDYLVFLVSAIGVLGASAVISVNAIADMDAGDTAVLKVSIDGGTKVVDIDVNTFFGGILIC